MVWCHYGQGNAVYPGTAQHRSEHVELCTKRHDRRCLCLSNGQQANPSGSAADEQRNTAQFHNMLENLYRQIRALWPL
ncbi:hypothetical protein NDU88_004998 [Pleurodeles waltl]|uniref:Uncharacterized protein n=1 Tax=Pleurodeles waltl TaxID=8319 RepID=A0AAV7KZX9_PLEWA|nr:hypothetical protein NDU88_004998 [Pleurodeles waltl]